MKTLRRTGIVVICCLLLAMMPAAGCSDSGEEKTTGAESRKTKTKPEIATSRDKGGEKTSSRPKTLEACVKDGRLFNTPVIVTIIAAAKTTPQAFGAELAVSASGELKIACLDMMDGINVYAAWIVLGGTQGASFVQPMNGHKYWVCPAASFKKPLLKDGMTAKAIRQILGPPSGTRKVPWLEGSVDLYYDGMIGFAGRDLWIDGPKFRTWAGTLVGDLPGNPPTPTTKPKLGPEATDDQPVVGIQKCGLFATRELDKETATLAGGTQVSVEEEQKWEVRVRTAGGKTGWVRRCCLCSASEYRRRKKSEEVPLRVICVGAEKDGRTFLYGGTMPIRNGGFVAEAGQAFWMDESARGKRFTVTSHPLTGDPQVLFLYKKGDSVAKLRIWSNAGASSTRPAGKLELWQRDAAVFAKEVVRVIKTAKIPTEASLMGIRERTVITLDGKPAFVADGLKPKDELHAILNAAFGNREVHWSGTVVKAEKASGGSRLLKVTIPAPSGLPSHIEFEDELRVYVPETTAVSVGKIISFTGRVTNQKPENPLDAVNVLYGVGAYSGKVFINMEISRVTDLRILRNTKPKPATPLAGGRTFSSGLRLEVFIIRKAGGRPERIGQTPSRKPLNIPRCASWGVQPLERIDMKALAREIAAKRIPALAIIGRATIDNDLAQLRNLTGLQGLDLRYTSITDAGLAHLKDLTGLRRLNLEDTNITDAGLAHLEDLTGLQELSLLSTKITDAGLTHLEGLTGLQELSLLNTKITDAGLTHLKGLTGLRMLVLAKTKITDAGLAHIEGMTGLQRLHVGGTRITDAGLVHLKGMTRLQELDLKATWVTDAGLAHLKGMTRLQTLDLTLLRITGAGLAHLKGMTGLQTLSLRVTKITNEGLAHLKGMTGLRELNLFSTGITDASLMHIKGLTELQELNLMGTKITDAGLAHLKGLTGLKELWLPSTITDAGLAHLKGLTGLQELWLIGAEITDAGLAHLKDLTRLQLLNLSDKKITDAGLAHLKGLTGLQSLDLSDKKITDAGLVHLKGLTRLRDLDLRSTKITDAGLVHLKGLTGLQGLNLDNTKIADTGLAHLKGMTGLQRLYLEKTKITDAGLVHLKGLTGLQELSLSKTKITDAGLVHLKGLTRLRDLDLRSTKITDAGAAELRKALPNTDIRR